MMKIRLPYEDFGKAFSKSGDRFYPVRIINKDGSVPFLVDVNQKDIQAEIDSYKDSCDIYKLLRDFVGEDLPSVVLGDGIDDVSSLPTNIFEIADVFKTARFKYDSMPEALKEEFTFYKFMQKMASNDGVISVYEKYFKPVTEPVTEPVVDKE